MISEDKIAEILTLEEESSSGEGCKFIDLENGWGIKCFDCSDGCEYSYVTQEEAAKHDLAPNVGKRFELTDHNGDGWFCHMTEVADCIAGYGYQNSQAEYFLGFGEGEPEDYLRDERDKTLETFYDVTGTPYLDDHVGNWGWITRGDERFLVPIDFNLCYKFYAKIMGIE